MPVSTPPNDASMRRTLATAGLPRRVRKVLEHAFRLVSEELDPRLGVLLNEFEQELYRLAEVSRDSKRQSDYMQTLRTLRMNRADLVPHFMVDLEAGLAAIRKVIPAKTVAAPAPEYLTLSLVDDAVLDEDTVLREIASRQEGRANLSLHLLGQRFGVLAGTPALDAERLPLGPQSLCRALRVAAAALQVSHDARLLLYRVFDRQVMAEYSEILEKLDNSIGSEGILPGLTYVPMRVRAGPVETDGSSASVHTEAPGEPERARPEVSRGGDAVDAAAADPQRPHTGWMAEPATPMNAADEEAAYASLQQLMSGRRELIGKLRPQAPIDIRLQLNTSDVDRALGTLQALPHASLGSPRTLMDIKQTLLAQIRQQRGDGATLSPQDDDIFELLNMLYGQIESEIRPEAPAAALLRRLQLPLLRVALQDRAFFVRGRHPARQLLDTVAETAAKWLGEDDFDPQLLLPLQEAVTHVVQEFDGDNAVFEASNDKLQIVLEAQVRKAELLERRHIEAARGKEKLEVAKQRSANTLTGLIGDLRLPKFSRALLNQAWADVLTLTLLRQGEDSEDWRKQLEVTRQIIFACSQSDARVEPALMDHIEAALSQVGYQGEEARVIAQRLTSNIADDEDDPASRTELAMQLKARTRLGEDSARTRKPVLPPRTPEEQLRYEHLRTIPFGTWIEFVTNQQGDVVRRRLSWFSPVTDNALFVNQRGQRVGEHTLDSLARMLVSGQAKIVTADRGRLVDRAWQAAMSALRSFAGRSDGDSAALMGAPA